MRLIGCRSSVFSNVMGARVALQKLRRRLSSEVKDLGLSFLGVIEIMEDDRRKGDLVKIEDNDNSVEKLRLSWLRGS